MTFNEWFVSFSNICRAEGYHGPIDKWSFEDEYERGADPAESAASFLDEMNS